MKRKTLLTLLILTISATLLSGCKASDSVDNSAVKSEVTETTAVESEATEEAEVITETVEEDAAETYQTNMKEVRNKMFGLDGITASEDKTSTSETTRTDYPDSNPEHQKAWDNFCENWNESDYGTTTAGKSQNDFQYYGDTGYDPKGTILQYRTTDKGYTVFYDTNTGRVYYTGMTLPTGDAWDENESAAVLTTYALSKGYNGFYDITYAEMQELLGTYAGD